MPFFLELDEHLKTDVTIKRMRLNKGLAQRILEYESKQKEICSAIRDEPHRTKETRRVRDFCIAKISLVMLKNSREKWRKCISVTGNLRGQAQVRPIDKHQEITIVHICRLILNDT